MAKKKNENTLSYLQMPLPTGGKYSKMTKVSFGGLNKRYTLDSGDLTMERDISASEYPYLTPSKKIKGYSGNTYAHPLSMFAFDDFLIVIYRDDNGIIYVDYLKEKKGEGTRTIVKYTSTLCSNIRAVTNYDAMEESNQTDYEGYHFVADEEKYYIYQNGEWQEIRPGTSVVQFNVYDTPTDILGGEYVKKLLVFPDRKSMDYEITESNFDIKDMNVYIKDYSNSTAEVDESGATIYPPPDNASHNYYYRNTADISGTNFGTDIYKWCEYPTKIQDEDGKWIEDGGTTFGWKVCIPPTMPMLKYATVHLSRVFGVDDNRVYASGFNDYTNWNLDTVDEYNESNSWCSPSQSNTKAGGKFTGITTFQNHVVCFKRDFMHEIYNTKNPFRLQDIYAEGTIDNRTIQDVDGKLIFVSEDDVKIYTGSNPRIIGYNLNMSKYTYAVAGTDNRNYYLYCEDDNDGKFLYVYDTFTELWSEQKVDSRVLNFAHNTNGMYMLCGDGVYRMDTDSYSNDWCFETELITNKTVNIKHIKKLQMLVDLDEGADMRVYILYDDEIFDENSSHLVYSSTKTGKLPIRVKPRKTANYGFKLHIEGSGYAKLYELEIFIEAGGDMYV